MSFDQWFATHKREAYIGAAGLGVAGLAYFKRKTAAAGASSAGPATDQSALSPSSSGIASTGAYDSSVLDAYGTLSSAISQQNDAIQQIASQLTQVAVNGGTGGSTDSTNGTVPSGGSGGATAPVTPTPAIQQTRAGVGYVPTTGVLSAGGSTYTHIPDVATDMSLRASGQTIYYEPVPGLVLPWPGNQKGAPTGTPLFVKTG